MAPPSGASTLSGRSPSISFRWRILADGLTAATTALWLDADVAILRKFDHHEDVEHNVTHREGNRKRVVCIKERIPRAASPPPRHALSAACLRF